ARGEYQGGAYIFDGASNNALQRSVKWPTCDAAYDILNAGGTENDLTALQRMECIPANHTSQIHWVKQDFFKLRDITARVPLGSLLSQTRSATLTVTAQNWFRWLNDDMRIFDPEIQGNGGRTRSGLDAQNRSITEHIPSPAVLTASLRVSF
ncbi:MAG: hypothetical protein OEZ54_11780, partial [Gemmatimonadota bacterium]|nr:hypothetical protein [Gemmatimonadota bacterium]